MLDVNCMLESIGSLRLLRVPARESLGVCVLVPFDVEIRCVINWLRFLSCRAFISLNFSGVAFAVSPDTDAEMPRLARLAGRYTDAM